MLCHARAGSTKNQKHLIIVCGLCCMCKLTASILLNDHLTEHLFLLYAINIGACWNYKGLDDKVLSCQKLI